LIILPAVIRFLYAKKGWSAKALTIRIFTLQKKGCKYMAG
jgi:hypothetical protein